MKQIVHFLTLVLFTFSINTFGQSFFFTTGTNWHYLDDGSDQGQAWRNVGFVHTWPEGPSPLGHGNNGTGDATTINKHNCTYLLKTVNIPNAAGLSNVEMQIVHDDGVIVYINGYEAFRSALVPPGELTYLDELTGYKSPEDERVVYPVSPLYFVDGDNLIAVELRNQREGSSDIQFDMIFTGDYVVGVEDEIGIPEDFQLNQNYPNPFNPSTTIKFALPKSGFYSIRVYNLLGQQVSELLNKEMEAGFHSVNFNAEDLTSGLYIYTLSGANVSISNKMLLMK